MITKSNVKLASDALLLRLYVQTCDRGYMVAIPPEIEKIDYRCVAVYFGIPFDDFRELLNSIRVISVDRPNKRKVMVYTKDIFVIRDYIRLWRS